MQEPINRSATPQARALLAKLYALSGRAVLAGQHNQPAHLSRWTDRVQAMTGDYPAVWGQDFGFSNDELDGIHYRERIVAEAMTRHRAGSIITMTWHAIRPTDNEPGTFKESIMGKLSDAEWRELTTPETALHTRWLAQIDLIAEMLTQLRDAEVPVLWRPLHEMNGGWFWWGGRAGAEGFQRLWKLMYERYTGVHALHNLLWVWSPNAPGHPTGNIAGVKGFFPGVEWVDVLALDVYHNDYQQTYYAELDALAEGKPLALGEVGELPSPEVLARQPRWGWFLAWGGMIEGHNTAERIAATYGDARVWSLEKWKRQGP